MSVVTITYIHCDGCGDAWDVAPMGKNKGLLGDTAAQQRRAARKQGWHTFPEPFRGQGALDYCPYCLEQR